MMVSSHPLNHSRSPRGVTNFQHSGSPPRRLNSFHQKIYITSGALSRPLFPLTFYTICRTTTICSTENRFLFTANSLSFSQRFSRKITLPVNLKPCTLNVFFAPDHKHVEMILRPMEGNPEGVMNGGQRSCFDCGPESIARPAS